MTNPDLVRATAFMALTLLLSWPLWLGVIAGKIALTPFGSFAPGVAALAMAALFDGREGLRGIGARFARWRVRPAAYVLALLGAPLLVTVALTLAPRGQVDASKLLLWPVAYLEVLLFTAVGEETGWRGYLLPLLLRRFSALRASIVVGLFWAVWHLPLFSIRGTPQSEVPFGYFSVNLMALSVLFTALFRWTGGSLWPPLLLHASVDTSLAIAGLAFPGSTASRRFWLAYFWLTIAVAIVVSLFGRKARFESSRA